LDLERGLVGNAKTLAGDLRLVLYGGMGVNFFFSTSLFLVFGELATKEVPSPNVAAASCGNC
jgi:hypothetical protein